MATCIVPRNVFGFVEIPEADVYVLRNCSVPSACLRDAEGLDKDADDDLVRCDIHIRDGCITDISKTGSADQGLSVDLEGGTCCSTFVDLHTHIDWLAHADKGHTCERSRNPTGNLTGADSSTARDASFWDIDDVFWRMDFSVRCAYAHGTSALRTHLINMVPKQLDLTWPAFAQLRDKWRGKVELQGVALVTLSFFRDEARGAELADVVARHGGALGAAVCCTHAGGLPSDDMTTCPADRDVLLDRVFELAKTRGLLLDFHVDENGNEESKGLRDIARKTVQHGYEGKVVCGHCCSLAWQSEADLKETLAAAAAARITVVSLPLVNEWTQDRAPAPAGRTPRWRGVTALHELYAAGVPVALASDNTRDQFYQYGDLDMLEVFTQGVRLGQLDRPIGAWPAAVTRVPARAMHLPAGHGVIARGGAADLVLFRARRYSELLSRPQTDRVVIRGGKAIAAVAPDYKLLDYNPQTREYLYRHPASPPDATPASAPGSELLEVESNPIARGRTCNEHGDSGKLTAEAGVQATGDAAAATSPRRRPPPLARGLSVVLASEAQSSPRASRPPSFERRSKERSSGLQVAGSADDEVWHTVRADPYPPQRESNGNLRSIDEHDSHARSAGDASTPTPTASRGNSATSGSSGKCPIPWVRCGEHGAAVLEMPPGAFLAALAVAALAGGCIAAAVRGRPP